MPTDIDVKLAEDLADFRLEAEKRFGSLEKGLGDIRGDMKELRSDLKWIKGIGASLIAIILAIGAGSGRVIWDAATVASDVRQQGRRLDQADVRLDRIDKRLDGIDAKLDGMGRSLERIAEKLDREAPATKR